MWYGGTGPKTTEPAVEGPRRDAQERQCKLACKWLGRPEEFGNCPCEFVWQCAFMDAQGKIRLASIDEVTLSED